MTRRNVLTLVILITLGSLAHITTWQADAGDEFLAKLNERMPGLLTKYRVPGAVVSYIKDGAVTWTQAYGLANLSTGAPMQPWMIFNFGSCGKVLTAWGVMRLVEQGKVDLDAPANQYLKRWQIPAGQYDPQKVTVRMLLSHTAGLTVHGFADYSPRRSLPSLVEMLQGQNQLDGAVTLFQEPGQSFVYSGGGYVLLQMIIEDVTGQPFVQFIQEQVTGPLGISSLHWTWTPDLQAAAATPYGPLQEALEYRQLGSQAIGSENSSVPDFARFIAAAVPGPNGEPAGRSVLSPQSIASMTVVQPGATDEGLAYGVTHVFSGTQLQHFGANTGWNAFFTIDTESREGLVMANNSDNGFPLNAAVQNLWVTTVNHLSQAAYEPPPNPEVLPLAAVAVLVLAGLLGLPLLAAMGVFLVFLRSGKRAWSRRPSRAALIGTGIWLLATVFWVYWFYLPLPLFFPPSFPDFWRMPQIDLVTGILVAWVTFSITSAWFPRIKPAVQKSSRS